MSNVPAGKFGSGMNVTSDWWLIRYQFNSEYNNPHSIYEQSTTASSKNTIKHLYTMLVSFIKQTLWDYYPSTAASATGGYF